MRYRITPRPVSQLFGLASSPLQERIAVCLVLHGVDLNRVHGSVFKLTGTISAPGVQ